MFGPRRSSEILNTLATSLTNPTVLVTMFGGGRPQLASLPYFLLLLPRFFRHSPELVDADLHPPPSITIDIKWGLY
jgi:hypothetical protein